MARATIAVGQYRSIVTSSDSCGVALYALAFQGPHAETDPIRRMTLPVVKQTHCHEGECLFYRKHHEFAGEALNVNATVQLSPCYSLCINNRNVRRGEVAPALSDTESYFSKVKVGQTVSRLRWELGSSVRVGLKRLRTLTHIDKDP